jgi:hypothetical protein
VFDYMGDEQLERDPQSGLMRLSDRKFWWTNREGVQLPPEPYDYQEVYGAETNENLASLIGLKLPDKPEAQQRGDVFDRQINQNQQQQQQPQQGHQQPQQGAPPPTAVTGEVVDGVPPGAQQQPQQLSQDAPPPTGAQGQAPGDGQQGGSNNPVGYA